MSKRILIDGRFVGVGDSQTRYVLELVKGILTLDQENSYTLLLRPVGEKELEHYPSIVNSPNLGIDILDIPHYSFGEQTKYLRYLNREKYDLVHFTQFNHPLLYRGKFVTTIQDLTLVGHLHYHNFIKQMAYNLVMKDAAKRSAKVIAISKFVKDDVIDFFKVSPEKFTLVYHGIDHENYNTNIPNKESRIEQFREKYHIEGDYILYTGMWKKHKNLIRLFQAFEVSKSKIESSPKLVLTGKIDKKEPEVIAEMERVNKKMPGTILTTGFIEEGELPIAYAGALTYVIPSLSEGFGWPPLEAMAVGTPVIASKESCIPEILGDAAHYFDPYDINDIAKAIEKILSDKELRKELVQKGLKQVQKYHWEETARKTLEVYKKAL